MGKSSLGMTASAMRTLFDRVYVINLPERVDRKREVAEQLGLVGLSFDDPFVELVAAHRPADRGDFESIGARGCFLSHLDVLDRAAKAGLNSILILEDDVNWTALAKSLSDEDIVMLKETGWQFLHGGSGHDGGWGAASLRLRPVPGEEGLMLSHFIGLRGPAIRQAADYLHAMLARPAGSPEGGPMHVDGAYCWLRKDHPDMAGYICEPSLARQRASRSNVSEAVGFRAIPVVARVLDVLRALRSRLKD